MMSTDTSMRSASRLFSMAALAGLLVLAVAAYPPSGQGKSTTATVGSASSGQIAFIRTSPDGSQVNLMTASPDGTTSTVVPLANRPETFSFPAWSPDGTKLLISHTFRTKSDGTCCLAWRPAIANPDGSGFTQLAMTYAPTGLDCPIWLVGGVRILCKFDAHRSEIFSVRAFDGGGPKLLIRDPLRSQSDLPTSISPNGKRFVFIRSRPGEGANLESDQMTSLFIANARGTGVRQLTPFGLTAAHEDAWAAWSPNGREILSVASGRPGHPGPITCFDTLGACLATRSHLFTIHPDGSGYHAIKLRLPASIRRYRILSPSWSPDGSKLVFCLWPVGGTEDIYTAHADGSHVVRVTNTPDFEYAPRWEPSQ
jgi:hypothetical protein